MTLCQFVKNHRKLIWYVRTAANEQWARFDLKTIFGVAALESAGEPSSYDADERPSYDSYNGGGYDYRHSGGYDERDRHGSYDQPDRRGSYGPDYGSSSPITRPVHRLVGVVLPPTRQWATDKTDAILSGGSRGGAGGGYNGPADHYHHHGPDGYDGRGDNYPHGHNNHYDSYRGQF